MIEYKGFVGHFKFDETKSMFYGCVANTNDVITFQGKSVQEIKQHFQDAVDEHIEWRKKYGKKPEKPSSLK